MVKISSISFRVELKTSGDTQGVGTLDIVVGGGTIIRLATVEISPVGVLFRKGWGGNEVLREEVKEAVAVAVVVAVAVSTADDDDDDDNVDDDDVDDDGKGDDNEDDDWR